MVATSENTMEPANTRRWPRFPAQLPVTISVESDSSKQVVPGLASEISRSGMALYGGVQVQPGDRMEVEFQTSGKPRVAGVVRNRSGFCFGLEFLDLLGSSRAAQAEAAWTESVLGIPALPEPEAPLLGEGSSSWKIWLTQHRGDVAVALAIVLLLVAISGWGVRSAQHGLAQPRNPSQPFTLFERMLIGLGMAEPPPAPRTTGNPAVQVWVDPHTALYYCPGVELYGNTPDGRVESQGDAQLDQFEPAARKPCE